MLTTLLLAPSSDSTQNIENELHSLISTYWSNRGFRARPVMRRIWPGIAQLQSVEDTLRQIYNAPSQYDLEVQFWAEASDESLAKVLDLLEEEE